MANKVQLFNDFVIQTPSYNESRCTRLLRLPNGILTLLVSDPSEDVASCSLCVAAGSHLDPDNLPGLAHMTEHMLFVSSKEYPKQEYYKQLVTDLGGSMNASTTGEQTTFFFSIPTNSSLTENLLMGDIQSTNKKLKNTMSNMRSTTTFDELLGVFSSFFVDPLFNASHLEKEIHAIENEHLQNMTSLTKKLYNGLRILSDNRHQFSRFCTGNFDTLYTLPKTNKTNLRSTIIKFFKENYLSENMTLVLRGPDSLNMLQKLALSKFSIIPSRHDNSSRLKVQDNESSGNHTRVSPNSSFQWYRSKISFDKWSDEYKVAAFNKGQVNRAILIDDDTAKPILRIYFPIDQIVEERLDPLDSVMFKDIWCQIMGDESEGSLIANLFILGYIHDSTAGVTEVATKSSLFSMQMTLTPVGAKNIESILNIIFEFSSMVFDKQNKKKITNLAKFMSQHNTIEILRFRDKDVSSSPFEESCDLSQLLHCDFLALPPKWLLKGSPVFDFDSLGYCGGYNESSEAKQWWISKASTFTEFVSQAVVPNNLLVAYIGKQESLKSTKCFSGIGSLSNIQDPYFLYDYKIVGIKISRCDNHPCALSLPRPNQFLLGFGEDQSLEIKRLADTSYKASKSGLGMILKNISSYSFPKLISYNEGYQFFFKKESGKRYKNKVFLTLDVIATYVEPSVACSLALEILCTSVKDELRETLYPASLLGYTWAIIPTLQGDARITINISGPKNKIFSILDLILNELKTARENIKSLVTNSVFRKSRVKLRSKYEGLLDQNSLFVAILGLYVALEENMWQMDERFECLENMSFDTFEKHLSELFGNKLYYICFLHGDADADEFRECIFPLLYKLAEPGISPKYLKNKTISLPKGKRYRITKTNSANDPTNSISMFIQTGQRSDIYARTLTKFIVYLMSTSLPHKLRSEAQLGYVVLVGKRLMRETLGIHISIMSGDYSPEYLEMEIDRMLYLWWSSTFVDKELTEDQFRVLFVNRFLNFIKNPNHSLESVGGPSSLFANTISSENGDSKLLKEHEIYWFQISSETYAFSKDSSAEDSIDLSILDTLSVLEFSNFIEEKILPNSKDRAVISIMIETGSKYAEQELMAMKLEGFLRMNSLNISKEKVKDILNTSKGSSAIMFKEFAKYFQSQGKLLKFMSVMTKEVFGALTRSMKSITRGANGTEVSVEFSGPDPIQIQDIDEFQSTLSSCKDYDSMNDRLLKLITP